MRTGHYAAVTKREQHLVIAMLCKALDLIHTENSWRWKVRLWWRKRTREPANARFCWSRTLEDSSHLCIMSCRRVNSYRSPAGAYWGSRSLRTKLKISSALLWDFQVSQEKLCVGHLLVSGRWNFQVEGYERVSYIATASAERGM
jgi:hypothetical protein